MLLWTAWPGMSGPDPAPVPDEFEQIAELFRPLTRGDSGALDLLDDAAILPAQTGQPRLGGSSPGRTMGHRVWFKDSDGGFSRAYGQMGPFLGARTNSLGLGQREGETKGLE
jgi:hypothetical protein